MCPITGLGRYGAARRFTSSTVSSTSRRLPGLRARPLGREAEKPLELHEIDLFRKRKAETLVALEDCMEKRALRAGELIFSRLRYTNSELRALQS